MIRVDDADREALVDFMFAHAPILMFPLTNLTRYGMGGGHPRAINAWVTKDGDKITDVLTISEEGIVFPCCPTEKWDEAVQVIKGRKIKGFLGEGQQVAALRHLDAPAKEAKDRATAEITAYITKDSHRVLFKDGVPVSMTGFNAELPEIVQVGGVFTPPALRSRGFARIALAMHLLEVSVDGVSQAVLSAANEAAARAYVALGFERSGSFAIAIYEDPQIAHSIGLCFADCRRPAGPVSARQRWTRYRTNHRTAACVFRPT